MHGILPSHLAPQQAELDLPGLRLRIQTIGAGIPVKHFNGISWSARSGEEGKIK